MRKIWKTSAPQPEPYDAAELLRLPPLDQTAELLSLGYNSAQIAEIRGLSSMHAANAQIQRIRRQLGAQAV